MFVDELKRLAAADPRVGAVADRAAEPLRVAVTGRRGVGCGTVARALSRAGVAVTSGGGGSDIDVVVYVVAEVIKPEDSAAVAAAPQPVLVVWNKADLAAARSGIPMVALLAVADLDDELWAALRALADGAPLRGGVDDVPGGQRRLCDTLDLTGIALAVDTLRRGGDTAAVRAVLHEVSGVDAVCARIAVAGAQARYRRILRCVAELEALAVDDGGGALSGFLSGFLAGGAVLATRAAVAAEALAAAGFPTPADGDQLHAAVTWRRYSRAPVSSVYQACADDVLRVSLRRWSLRGER